MEYRSGKCSQCGAEYKIPASFAHNVARCKVCKGVVHLSAPPRSAQNAPPGSGSEAASARARSAPPAPREARPASSEPRNPPSAPLERSAVPAPPRPSPAPAPAQPAPAQREPAQREPAQREPAAARASAAQSITSERGSGIPALPARKPRRAGLVVALVLVAAAALAFLFRQQLFGSANEATAPDGRAQQEAPANTDPPEPDTEDGAQQERGDPDDD